MCYYLVYLSALLCTTARDIFQARNVKYTKIHAIPISQSYGSSAMHKIVQIQPESICYTVMFTSNITIERNFDVWGMIVGANRAGLTEGTNSNSNTNSL